MVHGMLSYALGGPIYLRSLRVMWWEGIWIVSDILPFQLLNLLVANVVYVWMCKKWINPVWYVQTKTMWLFWCIGLCLFALICIFMLLEFCCIVFFTNSFTPDLSCCRCFLCAGQVNRVSLCRDDPRDALVCFGRSYLSSITSCDVVGRYLNRSRYSAISTLKFACCQCLLCVNV